MLRFGPRTALATALLATATLLAGGLAAAAGELSYNREIRSILVENCFSCHGADSAGRQADLRLDERDQAVESGAIVPGDPDSSVMLDRIFSDDPEEVMPPPETKKSLTAAQKELLVRWIKEGAEYEPHWSFIPPARPEPPAVKDESWAKNPIDRFILARLEAAGLAPAPEADRRTLARRAALDVTGLPPDPAAVEAFLADTRPDAFERYLDVLFADPAWGEHRGRHWLDYARYADTHGIHFDNEREMWTYRQWVIQAFNNNLPFDRFTELQLAGDLVELPSNASPDAVLQARIGSGFNRCNMTTNEGGIIDEEYVVLYARDRTETTATVWMGLTVGCAVCHDHKFDPVSSKDFYSLSAFFNNTTQQAKDGNVKDTPPILTIPLPEDRPRLAELERALPVAKRTVTERREGAKPAFEAFLAAVTPESAAAFLPRETPLVSLALAEGEGGKTRASLLGKELDLPLSPQTSWQAGPAGRPALVLDGRAAEIASAGDFEHDQAFTVSCWLKPPANDTFYSVVARMDEAADHRGWDLFVQGRRVGMHLSHAWFDDAFKVVATSQLPADAWTLITLAYDGSGRAEGVTIYYDGKPQKPGIETNTFKRNSIRTEVPLTIGSRARGSAAHGAGLAELTIHGRAFSAAEVSGLAQAVTLAEIVKLPPAERSKAGGSLYEGWLGTQDDAFMSATATVAGLEAEVASIKARGTIAHVMHEKDGMPMAHVLDRGEYDKRKEEVAADTPAALPPFPDHLPRNRLGLATWLLLPEHPLTARVTVNRFWQEVFGTGLVRTAGDFGITGELPSHPELLDWLAVEFREQGWDVKRLFRQMLTSAAYRQAAVTTAEKIAADRDNRLLSRGPRFRMDAEMIRDQALAASGLLVRKLGGPSVRPYQPEGVWEAVAVLDSNTRNYVPDSGEGLYRRSLYWFWKRSAPPASLDIFNAPSREICTVKRERTNTPLQALVTLNDPQFVEAARTLADLALEQPGDDAARFDFVAGRLLARPLDSDEREIAAESLAVLAGHYAAHPDDAASLAAVGASRPRSADLPRLAAWTMLVNQLSNLDEVLCK
jgi:mono/diheme cytochrome c family protein